MNYSNSQRDGVILYFTALLFGAYETTKRCEKKFVRYQEGAEKYSLGLTKFQALAKEAKATYKIDKVVLVNCEIFEKYLETFREY